MSPLAPDRGKGGNGPEGARARVLVVDDDEAFGNVVADVLTGRGYDALCVPDPLRALEEAARGGFAAAIVDLVMPRMDGLELAGRLKAAHPDLQVLLLTGHASLESAVAALDRGIFAYLLKDAARIGVLEHTLAGAVERHRLLRESERLMASLEESNRRLQVLQESALSLAAEIRPDRILDKVVGLAAELCRARKARALLFEPSGGDLVVRAAAGAGAEALRGARLVAGEGLAAQVAKDDAPLAVAEAIYHPRYSIRSDALEDAHLGLLCAPLRHESVSGALLVSGSRTGAFDSADLEMLAALGRQAAVALDGAFAHERAANFFTHASDILVCFLEALDVHHPGHSTGAAALADLVTRRLGMPDGERRQIHFATLLHDIGKVKIDRGLLEGVRLSDDARLRLREHPRLGADMLRSITAWQDLPSIILAHHERWDGKGYPAGLAGEDIPVGARVVAVVDAFDAMRRETPYRRARTEAEAISELEAEAGAQFDPRIVRLFVAALRDAGDPRRAGGSR